MAALDPCPQPTSTASAGPLILVPIGLGLFALGAGIGPAFQHLGARVLATTTAADNDRTSAGLGMVQLFASGLGAAIGGVTVNAAGLPLADSPLEVQRPPGSLFGVFAVIAAAGIPIAVLVTRRHAAGHSPAGRIAVNPAPDSGKSSRSGNRSASALPLMSPPEAGVCVRAWSTDPPV
ncbi:MAG: hypothetical protein QM687_09290 [Ferruginibacter sp.]